MPLLDIQALFCLSSPEEAEAFARHYGLAVTDGTTVALTRVGYSLAFPGTRDRDEQDAPGNLQGESELTRSDFPLTKLPFLTAVVDSRPLWHWVRHQTGALESTAWAIHIPRRTGVQPPLLALPAPRQGRAVFGKPAAPAREPAAPAPTKPALDLDFRAAGRATAGTAVQQTLPPPAAAAAGGSTAAGFKFGTGAPAFVFGAATQPLAAAAPVVAPPVPAGPSAAELEEQERRRKRQQQQEEEAAAAEQRRQAEERRRQAEAAAAAAERLRQQQQEAAARAAAAAAEQARQDRLRREEEARRQEQLRLAAEAARRRREEEEAAAAAARAEQERQRRAAAAASGRAAVRRAAFRLRVSRALRLARALVEERRRQDRLRDSLLACSLQGGGAQRVKTRTFSGIGGEVPSAEQQTPARLQDEPPSTKRQRTAEAAAATPAVAALALPVDVASLLGPLLRRRNPQSAVLTFKAVLADPGLEGGPGSLLLSWLRRKLTVDFDPLRPPLAATRAAEERGCRLLSLYGRTPESQEAGGRTVVVITEAPQAAWTPGNAAGASALLVPVSEHQTLEELLRVAQGIAAG